MATEKEWAKWMIDFRLLITLNIFWIAFMALYFKINGSETIATWIQVLQAGLLCFIIISYLAANYHRGYFKKAQRSGLIKTIIPSMIFLLVIYILFLVLSSFFQKTLQSIFVCIANASYLFYGLGILILIGVSIGAFFEKKYKKKKR